MTSNSLQNTSGQNLFDEMINACCHDLTKIKRVVAWINDNPSEYNNIQKKMLEVGASEDASSDLKTALLCIGHDAFFAKGVTTNKSSWEETLVLLSRNCFAGHTNPKIIKILEKLLAKWKHDKIECKLLKPIAKELEGIVHSSLVPDVKGLQNNFNGDTTTPKISAPHDCCPVPTKSEQLSNTIIPESPVVLGSCEASSPQSDSNGQITNSPSINTSPLEITSNSILTFPAPLPQIQILRHLGKLLFDIISCLRQSLSYSGDEWDIVLSTAFWLLYKAWPYFTPCQPSLRSKSKDTGMNNPANNAVIHAIEAVVSGVTAGISREDGELEETEETVELRPQEPPREQAGVMKSDGESTADTVGDWFVESVEDLPLYYLTLVCACVFLSGKLQYCFIRERYLLETLSEQRLLLWYKTIGRALKLKRSSRKKDNNKPEETEIFNVEMLLLKVMNFEFYEGSLSFPLQYFSKWKEEINGPSHFVPANCTPECTTPAPPATVSPATSHEKTSDDTETAAEMRTPRPRSWPVTDDNFKKAKVGVTSECFMTSFLIGRFHPEVTFLTALLLTVCEGVEEKQERSQPFIQYVFYFLQTFELTVDFDTNDATEFQDRLYSQIRGVLQCLKEVNAPWRFLTTADIVLDALVAHNNEMRRTKQSEDPRDQDRRGRGFVGEDATGRDSRGDPGRRDAGRDNSASGGSHSGIGHNGSGKGYTLTNVDNIHGRVGAVVPLQRPRNDHHQREAAPPEGSHNRIIHSSNRDRGDSRDRSSRGSTQQQPVKDSNDFVRRNVNIQPSNHDRQGTGANHPISLDSCYTNPMSEAGGRRHGSSLVESEHLPQYSSRPALLGGSALQLSLLQPPQHDQHKKFPTQRQHSQSNSHDFQKSQEAPLTYEQSAHNGNTHFQSGHVPYRDPRREAEWSTLADARNDFRLMDVSHEGSDTGPPGDSGSRRGDEKRGADGGHREVPFGEWMEGKSSSQQGVCGSQGHVSSANYSGYDRADQTFGHSKPLGASTGSNPGSEHNKESIDRNMISASRETRISTNRDRSDHKDSTGRRDSGKEYDHRRQHDKGSVDRNDPNRTRRESDSKDSRRHSRDIHSVRDSDRHTRDAKWASDADRSSRRGQKRSRSRSGSGSRHKRRDRKNSQVNDDARHSTGMNAGDDRYQLVRDDQVGHEGTVLSPKELSQTEILMGIEVLEDDTVGTTGSFIAQPGKEDISTVSPASRQSSSLYPTTACEYSELLAGDSTAIFNDDPITTIEGFVSNNSGKAFTESVSQTSIILPEEALALPHEPEDSSTTVRNIDEDRSKENDGAARQHLIEVEGVEIVEHSEHDINEIREVESGESQCAIPPEDRVVSIAGSDGKLLGSDALPSEEESSIHSGSGSGGENHIKMNFDGMVKRSIVVSVKTDTRDVDEGDGTHSEEWNSVGLRFFNYEGDDDNSEGIALASEKQETVDSHHNSPVSSGKFTQGLCSDSNGLRLGPTSDEDPEEGNIPRGDKGNDRTPGQEAAVSSFNNITSNNNDDSLWKCSTTNENVIERVVGLPTDDISIEHDEGADVPSVVGDDDIKVVAVDAECVVESSNIINVKPGDHCDQVVDKDDVRNRDSEVKERVFTGTVSVEEVNSIDNKLNETGASAPTVLSGNAESSLPSTIPVPVGRPSRILFLKPSATADAQTSATDGVKSIQSKAQAILSDRTSSAAYATERVAAANGMKPRSVSLNPTGSTRPYGVTTASRNPNRRTSGSATEAPKAVVPSSLKTATDEKMVERKRKFGDMANGIEGSVSGMEGARAKRTPQPQNSQQIPKNLFVKALTDLGKPERKR